MMTEDFLNYLRYERNRSELTVRRYEQSLRDFESYFKNRDSQLSWESVDSDVIRDWMESMMDKGDMEAPTTVCSRRRDESFAGYPADVGRGFCRSSRAYHYYNVL